MSKRKIVLETKLTLAEIEERFDLHVERSQKNQRKTWKSGVLGAFVGGNIDGNKFWFDAKNMNHPGMAVWLMPRWHEYSGEIIETTDGSLLVGNTTNTFWGELITLPVILLFLLMAFVSYGASSYILSCFFCT